MPEAGPDPAPETQPTDPPDGGDDAWFDVDLETARQRRSLKWRRYPGDVIPLWVAEMDFPAAPVIAQRLSELVERGDFGYPPEPPEMDPSEFAAAVAGWMEGRHGWVIDPELVSITPDTMRVLEIAIALLTEPGDPVVVTDPAYPPFRDSIEEAGRTPWWVPMVDERRRWTLDLDALEAAFSRPEVRLYLHCNPHNPTGTVFTVEEMRAIAGMAERHDVYVVSDEVHADIGPSSHVPLATVTPTIGERTITASAATKAFNLAGLRCGFAIAGSRDLHGGIRSSSIRGRRLNSLPGYEATLAAFSGGAPWLDRVNRHLVTMRDHVAARLRTIDASIVTSVPAGTYLMWTDWRQTAVGADPGAFLLHQARVALYRGEDFGPSGAGFLRLNFATSRRILDEAFDRIEAALSSR